MTVYIIRGEAVTAHRSAPELLSEGEVVVGSVEEIAASGLSLARMVAIWNALPGTTSITKFQDRKTAAQRLWTAFAQLPVEPEPAASAADPRAGSKQAQVIGLLQRPEGATIDEVAAAMGWQRRIRARADLRRAEEKTGPPGRLGKDRARPALPHRDGTEGGLMSAGEDLGTALAGLARASRHHLAELWAEYFGAAPPPRTSRSLMIRAVAYKMQERELGGLSAVTRRLLSEEDAGHPGAG